MDAPDESMNGISVPVSRYALLMIELTGSFTAGDGFPLPAPDNIVPRPLTSEEEARIDTLSRLQFVMLALILLSRSKHADEQFLATAPTRWSEATSSTASRITKFQLPNSECISCILWNGLYHITGTDIVRALAFRFEAFGRPIHATKKWEEGVFSDLRNLKPGQDACLEEPKSPLLDFLFRNGCIRTQKKQKVFYWFSVPHDRLFLDALERDLKREKVNQEPTSIVVGEPARSFKYDPRRSLYDQFAGQNPGLGANYFVGGPNMGGMHDPGASPAPYDPYYGGPPPMPLSLQPPPGAPMGAMPPHGPPGYGGYHPSYPPPGASMHAPPPHGPPPGMPMGMNVGMGMGMGVPPHMRNAISPAPSAQPMHMAPPPAHGASRYIGFRPSAPLEGSPHYKRRRSRPSQSPAVQGMMAREENGSPAPAGPNDSFASDESMSARKKPRGASRAASVAASGITGRSGSVDSVGEPRMYPCPYSTCRRPFRRLEHLRRHVRTHTQEKPFWCPRCPKKFARQDNLTNHLRVHEKHDGSGAEGDASGDFDPEASEYEEEEGMNVNMSALPREWSATPGDVMSRNVSGSSVGGMSYTRHSTLPPKFPPNFAMYNPGHASGPVGPPGVGAAGDFISFQPENTHGMPAPPHGSSLYPSNLGMGAPMDSRRHRSATPYAPVNSSNLAYSQPVTAGSWQNEHFGGSASTSDFASADMTGSSSTGAGMPYAQPALPGIGMDGGFRATSVDPAHLHLPPHDMSMGQPDPTFSVGMGGQNGDPSMGMGMAPPGYVTTSTPLIDPHAAVLPGKPDGQLSYMQHQLHITVPTPSTASTPFPNTAGTGMSISDSLLPGQGHGHKPKPLNLGNGHGQDAAIPKAPGSASAVPTGWGWKSASAGKPE